MTSQRRFLCPNRLSLAREAKRRLCRQFIFLSLALFCVLHLASTVLVTLLYCSSSQTFGSSHGSSVVVVAILLISFPSPIVSIVKFVSAKFDFVTYFQTSYAMCISKSRNQITI